MRNRKDKRAKERRRQYIKMLALDIHNGLMFSSASVAPGDAYLLPSIFLTLLEHTPEQSTRTYFSYLSRAVNWTVKGYPVFQQVDASVTPFEMGKIQHHLRKYENIRPRG